VQDDFVSKTRRKREMLELQALGAALEGGSAQAAAAHRRLEAWRARLLEDDAALTDFAAEHPGADLQALRTVIRNSRQEQKLGKPPRAYRELFRMLKSLEP
jgi:ribosome-associated protein